MDERFRLTPLTGASLDEVRRIKGEHLEELTSNPLVNGVGIGIFGDEKGRRYGIKVNLSEPLSEELAASQPLEIDGIPVQYQVVGKIVAS